MRCDNVTTFNFHPHLPHYELTAPESDGLRVVGQLRNLWHNLATMK
jgi:hypothetical protein